MLPVANHDVFDQIVSQVDLAGHLLSIVESVVQGHDADLVAQRRIDGVQFALKGRRQRTALDVFLLSKLVLPRNTGHRGHLPPDLFESRVEPVSLGQRLHFSERRAFAPAVLFLATALMMLGFCVHVFVHPRILETIFSGRHTAALADALCLLHDFLLRRHAIRFEAICRFKLSIIRLEL